MKFHMTTGMSKKSLLRIYFNRDLHRKLDQRAYPERRRTVPKSLGDAATRPVTQNIGVFAVDQSEEFELFTKLAERYTIEGDDRQAICSTNALVRRISLLRSNKFTFLLS